MSDQNHILTFDKVIWTLPPIQTLEDFFANMRGKSLKKFCKKYKDTLESEELSYHFAEVEKQEEWNEWLSKYREVQTVKNYRILADESFFSTRRGSGVIIYQLSVRKESDLVGSGIVTYLKSAKKTTIAYKFSTYQLHSSLKNASLGALIETLLVSESLQLGAEIISGGKSRNRFGIENTIGYLEMKLSLGYLPSIDKETVRDFDRTFTNIDKDFCAVTQRGDATSVVCIRLSETERQRFSKFEEYGLQFTYL